MKKLIAKILNSKGYKVFKVPSFYGKGSLNNSNYAYEWVVPNANYAPWLNDTLFSETFEASKPNTLVDIYRCFELWELTESIYKLNPEAQFIEVGVWRGGTANIIAKKLAILGSKANFYLADTFTGVKKASDKDAFYFDNEHADTSIDTVKNLLGNKYEGIQILTGLFPEETGHLVKENVQFGLCHIDVDVYNSAKDIVEWIWDKLIIGGVIVFDDYGFHTCNGVTTLVNEYKAKTDRVIVHNLNGHALMIKVK
jgi:O-methyltransferase